MTTKLIAIDLDGTLLHSNNTISNYTVEVLRAVRQLGHHIVLTTGRPYRMAIDHYHHLKLDSPLITFNGAFTNFPEQNWSGEHSVPIETSYLLELLKHSDTFELDFIASEYRDNVYVTNPDQIDPKFLGLTEIPNSLLLEPHKLTGDPYGILLKTRAQDKEALATAMRQHFNHHIEVNTWGGPLNILEISSKGVHKGYALKRLLDYFRLSPQALIAFGDEKNDITMLQLAGQGFAMKNANPQLVAFADEQLHLTNEQDGVANTLEKLFL